MRVFSSGVSVVDFVSGCRSDKFRSFFIERISMQVTVGVFRAV